MSWNKSSNYNRLCLTIFYLYILAIFIVRVVIKLYQPKYSAGQILESVHLHGQNGTIMGMKLRSSYKARICEKMRRDCHFSKRKRLSVCLDATIDFLQLTTPFYPAGNEVQFHLVSGQGHDAACRHDFRSPVNTEAETRYHAWKECNEVRKWKPDRNSRSENTLPLSTHKPVQL